MKLTLLFVWPMVFTCEEWQNPPVPELWDTEFTFIADTTCRPGTECVQDTRQWLCYDHSCHSEPLE